MGLGPLWVRRRMPDDDAVESPDARAARIAALDWAALQAEVAGCRACRLCETRTQTVFGVGSEHPDWLVVGEGPGAEEDATGEPFVGKAGKLLDAMLAAVGFTRGERPDRGRAYIANVVKCRPPGNRDPLPDEIERCRPFLERQIALLAPKLVLVVGKVASGVLLKSEGTMGSLRGKAHRIEAGGRAVPVVATYHPAYLLRSPDEKAKAWADLCFARALHERDGDDAV